MNRILRNAAKKIILRVLPDSNRLRYIAYRPRFETWSARHADGHPSFHERLQMYEFLNAEIAGNGPLTYLEFGVFEGESIKHWAGINTHPESRFFGFDTFMGLPEDWDDFSRTVRREGFDVGGNLPKVDDPRVGFVKGLFQDTLPSFLQGLAPRGQLVIHIDADLYSSTLYVLTAANRILVPGSIVIFDEFYSVLHEFRALEDYCASYMREYEVLAATTNHGRIAIRMS